MQLAHPLVAQGVADHSGFETDPLARLRATLEATYTIVFGTDEAADRTVARIRAVHDTVHGPGYDANDPDLLCWVNATLSDTALRVYRSAVGSLSDRDAARYYEDTTRVAELLGCPRDAQPSTLRAFDEYVSDMVQTLRVTDNGRRLAHAVLHPRLPFVAEPPLALFRFVTVGLLPRPLRDQYGLRWDHRRERAFRAGATATRSVLTVVPAPIRRAPLTYFHLAA